MSAYIEEGQRCHPVLGLHSPQATEEFPRDSLVSLRRNLEVKGRTGTVQLPRSSEKTTHLKRGLEDSYRVWVKGTSSSSLKGLR